MRDLALDEPAALIYCPYRALLHLPTWADRRRVFERVAVSFVPGGRFAWNAFAFDHRIAFEQRGERHLTAGIAALPETHRPHLASRHAASARVAACVGCGRRGAG